MLKHTNEKFIRVQKRTAKKLFYNGSNIYMLPCKANINSPWFASPCMININKVEKKVNYDNDYSFSYYSNEFEAYNCCSELGYYAAYYIES